MSFEPVPIYSKLRTQHFLLYDATFIRDRFFGLRQHRGSRGTDSRTLLNQPSGTITERIAKAKANPRLFVNREIFNQFSAAREVEFEEKMAKIKAASR